MMARTGRPLKFKSVKQLEKKIDEYFESCMEEQWYQDLEGNWKPVLDRNGNVVKKQVKPFTITGLASFLGTNRQTLLNYEERDEFFDTINKAKTKIEAYAEESLWSPKIAPGVIFNLKNNFGWVDKQEVDQNVANKDGKPFEVTNHHDLSKLSVEELRALESILSKTTETD
jgi:hypothetical protein